MNFGDNIGTMRAAPIASGITAAGAVIRYGFYFFGMAVFGMIAFVMLYGWNHRVTRVVDDKPAFRINDRSVTVLPASSEIIQGGNLGRIEVLRYGTIHDREADMTLAMVTPRKDAVFNPQIGLNLRDANLMRNARTLMTSNYYDLETRFGAVRAVEMRVDSDGRWKQCLAYRSRFDNNSVYLIGWSCDGSGAKPSPDALACTLDKLTLDKPLASKDADTFLKSRASRPAHCAARPVTQTSDTGSRRVSPPSRWSQPTSSTPLPRF